RWKDEAEAKGATIRIKEKLGRLPLILGSRAQLMAVLTHLIFNAVEGMPEGGDITVKTEAKEDEVLLYFTDSGKGIPEGTKDRIFEPFFTTKGPKASGLGLSVCHGIIKHHQGKIELESTEGKGATFTISIPAQLDAPSKKEKLNDS
ncbi:HAMP domain-containing histidine kinase, partial [Candidatus Aerophobetes bacterium]|nr:HAMP domain-containing histidine kinase [Candidatus Aerophobetes bacterium]